MLALKAWFDPTTVRQGAAPRVGKSNLAEAIRYATSRCIALERFLSEGPSRSIQTAGDRQQSAREKRSLRAAMPLPDDRHAPADREDERHAGSHVLSRGRGGLADHSDPWNFKACAAFSLAAYTQSGGNTQWQVTFTRLGSVSILVGAVQQILGFSLIDP